MLILAADTSTESMGVALWQEQNLVAENILRIGLKHAVTFMPAVKSLIAQAGKTTQDVDAFACTTGPGSFTGIRIGISAIKAMAFAADKPAFGISTLVAIASNYEDITSGIICPMLDARNDRIYASAWLRGVEVIREDNWQAAEYLAVVRLIYQQNEKIDSVNIIGSGKEVIRRNSLLPSDLPCVMSPSYQDYPRAAVIAAAAERKLMSGENGNPDLLLPSYLGLSQAERMAGSRNNGSR